MPPALGRFLRITGLSAAVAFVYGLARSARRPNGSSQTCLISFPAIFERQQRRRRRNDCDGGGGTEAFQCIVDGCQLGQCLNFGGCANAVLRSPRS